MINLNSTNKIRLLILTPSLQCGGSEKFVSILCNHINTEVFSVCLIVINNANPFYTITNPAIEIIDLKKERVLFSLFAIKAAVKKFKPGIVFSTANHLNLYLAIFRKRFDAGIKFIAREASIVSINSQQAKMPVIYNRLIKKYYNRFDCIVCQSAYMQQDLVHHYNIAANKTRVIHNASPGILNRPPQPGRQNTELVYKFITVARLRKEKGIERLIQAVGLLSVPYQYFIFGDGNKRKDLQDLINELQLQDKVFLMGEKRDPFTGMEDADLFLLGSYYEGFPNVLLEAGILGIPAVAFNVPGGIAEIITEEENGLLVQDNDIIGFAAAIKKGLLVNFNKEKIIETTNKRFAAGNVIPELENLFLKLVGNK
jgi:glycosyltransferase involved in cell wall biosynthesis